MSRHLVVVTDDRFGDYSIEQALVEEVGGQISIMSDMLTAIHAATLTDWPKDQLDLLSGAEVLLANLFPITPAVLDGATKCHTVVRYGVGYDSVDIPAATARGVAVVTVPGFASPEVAAHATALWVALERRLLPTDRAIRAGGWPNHGGWPLRRLSTITAGILGYGAISRALVPMIHGFGVTRVLVHDIKPIDPPADPAHAVESVSFDRLLSESDVLFLLAPHTPETHHIINRESLKRMKREAILINTARGGLVELSALGHALGEGTIRAAGLDVFESEPPPEAADFADLEDCIMTGHMAYFSRDSVTELKRRAAEYAVEALSGSLPASTVNPEVEWRRSR